MISAQQLFDHVVEADPESFLNGYKISFPGEARISRIVLKGGEVIIQSVEHYIANIYVIDCFLDMDDRLKLTMPKSVTFFEVLRSPGVRIYRDGISVDEYSEQVCSLVNYPTGKYSFQLVRGTHRIILLNVNLLWLSGIVDKFPSFSDLLVAKSNNQYQRMQECPFRDDMRRSVSDLIYNGKQKLADHETEFLASLNKIIRQYHDDCASRQLRVELKLEHKAKRLVAFLELNYADPEIDIVTVAKELNMSNKSVQRLAKMIFGIGLREQIIKYRMTYAVRYLAVDKMSVKEVAKLTGYTSATYFSRAFSKYWKIAPSELVNPKNNILL